MKQAINRLLRAAIGYEITAYNTLRRHELRRLALLRDRRVTLVVDAGANKGQFAAGLRAGGYTGRIISIEPLPAVFAELTRRMAADGRWAGLNVAVGATDGEADLHTPDITEVSSLLPAIGSGVTAGWRTARAIRVPVRTLDGIVAEAARPDDVVHLKLDIQGGERQALDGGAAALARVVSVELEASTVQLYAGETLFPELLARLDAAGFELFSIDTALVDARTGRVLQVDGLFARRGASGEGGV